MVSIMDDFLIWVFQAKMSIEWKIAQIRMKYEVARIKFIMSLLTAFGRFVVKTEMWWLA